MGDGRGQAPSAISAYATWHAEKKTAQLCCAVSFDSGLSPEPATYNNGTNNNATMLMILIKGLIAGPAVSLYGSPTVSPVTAALWVSEPLPPKLPSSMYFLALSHAPPPVHIEIATNRPVTIVPISTPPSALMPAPGPISQFMTIASTIGTRIGRSEGTIISLIADFVSRSTARE